MSGVLSREDFLKALDKDEAPKTPPRQGVLSKEDFFKALDAPAAPAPAPVAAAIAPPVSPLAQRQAQKFQQVAPPKAPDPLTPPGPYAQAVANLVNQRAAAITPETDRLVREPDARVGASVVPGRIIGEPAPTRSIGAVRAGAPPITTLPKYGPNDFAQFRKDYAALVNSGKPMPPAMDGMLEWFYQRNPGTVAPFLRSMNRGITATFPSTLGSTLKTIGETISARGDTGALDARGESLTPEGADAGGMLQRTGKQLEAYAQAHPGPAPVDFSRIDPRHGPGYRMATAGAEMLGEGVSSTVPVIAGGIVGGALGGIPGAAVGAAAPSFAMNTGDVRQELDQLGIDDPALVRKLTYLVGTGVSVLDILGPLDMLHRLMPKGASKEVQHGIIRSALKHAGIGALEEGVTEPAQELLQYFGSRAGAGLPTQWEEALSRAAQASKMGALTGGVMGGGGAALSHTPAPAAPPGTLPSSRVVPREQRGDERGSVELPLPTTGRLRRPAPAPVPGEIPDSRVIPREPTAAPTPQVEGVRWSLGGRPILGREGEIPAGRVIPREQPSQPSPTTAPTTVPGEAPATGATGAQAPSTVVAPTPETPPVPTPTAPPTTAPSAESVKSVIPEPHEYIPASTGRALTEEQMHVRNVADGLRTGQPDAIAYAAPDMAQRIPDGAVLVPLPDHTGSSHANEELAWEMTLHGNFTVAADVLSRTGRVDDSQAQRAKGKPGVTADEHEASLTATGELPTGKPVVFIDAIETTGGAAEGARRVLKQPDAQLVTYAKAPIPAGEVRAQDQKKTVTPAAPAAAPAPAPEPTIEQQLAAAKAENERLRAAAAPSTLKPPKKAKGAKGAKNVEPESATGTDADRGTAGAEAGLQPTAGAVDAGGVGRVLPGTESAEGTPAGKTKTAKTAKGTAAAPAGEVPTAQPEPEAAGRVEKPKRKPLTERTPVEGPTGRTGYVHFSDGSRVKTRYRLVEADDVQASHDPHSFAHNLEYPEDVQGREYEGDLGKPNREHVIAQTGKLDSRVIDAGSGLTDGPPLITSTGITVAGNQRAMMVRRAQTMAPEKAAALRAELMERAEQFGLDPAEIEAMKAPMLVREIIDPSIDQTDIPTLSRLNQLSDQTSTKSKDALSAALGRAKRMAAASDALAHFSATIEEDKTIRAYLATGNGAQFVRMLFQDSVFAPQERAEMLDAKGDVTEAGKDAIEQLLRMTAIGDINVIYRTPPSILRKLDSALPAIIQANGTTDYSLKEDLQAALDLLYRVDAKRADLQSRKEPTKGFGVEAYMDLPDNQPDMFGAEKVPQHVQRLALMLERDPKAEITQGLRAYAKDAVVAQEASQSEDIFGEAPETKPQLRSRLTAPKAKEEGGLAEPFMSLEEGAPEEVGPAELRKLLQLLTPEEAKKINRGSARRIIAHLKTLPSKAEMAAVAYAGRAKRGWYRHSAQALNAVFGADAPRFALLLAAMSPQLSVEANLLNALNMWKNWTAAGRPTDEASIVGIMGRSVQGTKGDKSVLDAWRNNTVSALSTTTPETTVISGPKVNSFFRNLTGFVNEVTNDAWMATYAAVDQGIFGGQLNVSRTDPGKGSGYLAMSARTREAAKVLSDLTGETWTPAEVQETIWSWAKTLYEMASGKTETRTEPQLVRDKALTDALINSTPDFRTLFFRDEYAAIFREAGYGKQLESLQRNRRLGWNAGRLGGKKSGTRGQTAPFARDTQQAHEVTAARRLRRVRDQRAAEAAAKAAREEKLERQKAREAKRLGSLGEERPESPFSYARSGEKVGAGFDKSLIQKLGANMYKGDLGVVALKESIQNAIDSVRSKGHGAVRVIFDAGKNTLVVGDTGQGMTPAQMETVFVDIGGSGKDALESSGGYGLAKVALFSRSKEIFAESVAKVGKKWVMTTLKGSGEDWANQEMTLTTKDLGADLPENVTSGTRLKLVFDDTVKPNSWQMKTWAETFTKYSRLEHTVRIEMKEYGDTEVKSTEKDRMPLVQDEPLKEVDVPGATIKIYETAARKPSGSSYDSKKLTVNVLNRGVYQFSASHYLENAEGLPEGLIVDVHPTVGIDHPDYPFTTSREELKKAAADELDKVIKDTAKRAAKREIETMYKTLVTAPKIVGPNGKATDYRVLADRPDFAPEVVDRIRKDPQLAQLAETLEKMMVEQVTKARRRIDMPTFSGLGVSEGWLGINIRVSSLAAMAKLADAKVKYDRDSPNEIYYNPFATYKEVREGIAEDARNGMTFGDRDAEVAWRMAGQAWSTMLHEVAHQLARGHDTAFAGQLTRLEGDLARYAGPWIDLLESQFRDALASGFRGHQIDLEAAWANDQRKGVLDKIGDHHTPAGDDPGSLEAARARDLEHGDGQLDDAGEAPSDRGRAATEPSGRGRDVRGGAADRGVAGAEHSAAQRAAAAEGVARLRRPGALTEADLFGEEQAPAPRAKPRLRRPGQPQGTRSDASVIAFRSGANNAPDIRGFADSGESVGVSASELTEKSIQELEALAGKGINVLLDSGAYTEFGRPDVKIDFDRVLAIAKRLSAALGKNLYIVAPDKVGDQQATLQRLAKYRTQVNELAKTSNVFAAIQRGELSAADFFGEVKRTLGNDDVVPAMPLKKAAMSNDEVVEFAAAAKPTRIHFLGMGPDNAKYPDLVSRLRDTVPGIQITADSNRISAMVGKTNAPGGGPRALTKHQQEIQAEGYDTLTGETEGEFGEREDYTDEIAQPSRWLPIEARRGLASNIGLSQTETARFVTDPDTFLQSAWGDGVRYDDPVLADALDQAWKAHLDTMMAPTRRAEAVRRTFKKSDEDLFGTAPEPAGPEQGGLFGSKEGTAGTRRLEQVERTAKAELDKLRLLAPHERNPEKAAKLARRIAELSKLVNRNAAISSEELAARAKGAEKDEAAPPIATSPDQGSLFEPRPRTKAQKAQLDFFADIQANPTSPEAIALDRQDATAAFGGVEQRDKLAAELAPFLAQLTKAGHTPATERARLVARKLAEPAWVDLTGLDLSTPQKLRAAVSVMRHPLAESLFVAFKNADGEAVGSFVYASGALATVKFDMKAFAADVIAQAKALGVHRVVVGHNHPSGNPTPSEADRAWSVWVEYELLKNGILLEGHMTIDHDTAVWMPSRGGFRDFSDQSIHMPGVDADADYRTAVQTGGVPLQRLNTVSLLADAVSPHSTTVFYLDVAGRVVAAEPRSMHESVEQLIDRVHAQRTALAAFDVVIAAPALRARVISAYAMNARLKGEARGHYVTDVLTVSPNGSHAPTVTSLTNEGSHARPDLPWRKADVQTRAVIATRVPQPAGYAAGRDVLDARRSARLRGPGGLGLEERVSAYHGTPHEVDRFDTGKIGTGEGAQTFGWGLYFAGRKEVADYYRAKLTGQQSGGGRFRALTVEENSNLPTYMRLNILNPLDPNVAESARDQVRAYLATTRMRLREDERRLGEKRHWLGGDPEARLAENKRIIAALEKLEAADDFAPVREGRLYTAQLPDEHTFLDRDKPLSEQTPYVREALEKSGVVITPNKYPSIKQALNLFGSESTARAAREDIGSRSVLNRGYKLLHEWIAAEGPDAESAAKDAFHRWFAEHGRSISPSRGRDITGGSFYDMLAHERGFSSEQASKHLASLGIHGLKYLDEHSRDPKATTKTHNYVVFDDKHVDIMGVEEQARDYGGGGENVIKKFGVSDKPMAITGRLTTADGNWVTMLDPRALLALPGQRGEENKIETARVARLVESMREKGFEKGYAVAIDVDHRGRPSIYEGNHRIRAAAELGIPVPAEVRYLGMSERAKNPWIPKPAEPPSFLGEASPDEEEEGPTTGIKNAVSAAMRKSFGADQRIMPDRRTFDEMYEAGKAVARRDPGAIGQLLATLTADPEHIVGTEQEAGLLLKHRVDLENKLHTLLQAATDAAVAHRTANPLDTEPSEAETRAREQLAAHRKEMLEFVKLTERTGTATGRALNARKMMSQLDYSLGSMEAMAEAEKGKPLTQAELDRIHAMYAEIQDTLAAVQAEAQRAHERAAVAEAELQHALMRLEVAEPLAARITAKLESEADKARARLKARGFRAMTGLDPQDLADLAIIGAETWAKGARQFADWSKKMLGMLGPSVEQHLPEIFDASTLRLDAEINAIPGTQKTRTPGAIKPPKTTDTKTKMKRRVERDGATLPELRPYLRKLALELIRAGTTQREDILDVLHAIVQEVLPEATRTEVRDALSGYGDFKALDPEAAKARLREISAESQKLAQLEALKRRESPLATGFERQPPNDETRRLQQLINAEKKIANIPEDAAGLLKSALASAKTRTRNMIKDLQTEIDTGQRIVKGKTVLVADAELQMLKDQLAALRKVEADVFKKPGLTDEQRLALAVRLMKGTVEQWAGRLAAARAGTFGTQQRPKLQNAELDALRAEADAAREEYNALRAADPNEQLAAVERSNVHYRANLARREAELRARMAAGDYLPRPKKIGTQLDAESLRVQTEYEGAKRRWKQWVEAQEKAHRTRGQKVLGALAAAPGVAKSIKASLDMSALFRQGLRPLITHPKTWVRNSRQSFLDVAHTFQGKDVMDEVLADIRTRANVGLYARAKLAVSAHEESYPTSLPSRIPYAGRVFKASEDAYTAFQYRMRADIFDQYIDLARAAGVDVSDTQQLQSIGKLVNSLTARGHLGKRLEPAAGAINDVFFSPRSIKSHWDVLTAHTFDKTTSPFAKQQARKNLLKIVAVMAIVMLITRAVLDDDAVELDPRSADFGRIRIGDTRFDISGGMRSLVTLAARLVTMSTKSSTSGKVSDYNTGKFGSPTALDALYQFFENKLSPVAGVAKELLRGRTFAGEKPTLANEAVNLLAPLSVTNAAEILRNPDGANAVAVILADFFGIGTQTYSPRKPGLRSFEGPNDGGTRMSQQSQPAPSALASAIRRVRTTTSK